MIKPRLIVYDVKGAKYNQIKHMSKITPNAIALLQRAYAMKLRKGGADMVMDDDVVVINIVDLDRSES